MRDKMIPLNQAKQLKERCFGPCTLITPENMTHNRFDVYNDVVRHIRSFLIDRSSLDAKPEGSPQFNSRSAAQRDDEFERSAQ